MGLFDGIRKSFESNLNVQQAIMTIVIAVIKADGEVSNQEVGRVRAMCGLSPIFASNTGDQDMNLISFADNLTNQLKNDAITKAIAALSTELRETAFAFSTDMILADGILGPDEEKFLGGLASAMNLNEDIGRNIINVTLIRNRSEK